MTTKRKKVVLTIKQKLELIERFEKGESTAKLAQDYGIGVQTVRDIRKNKVKFEEFVGDCESIAGPSKRKTMKKSTYEDLDLALLRWFRQKRNEGVPISGPECIDQAKLFHEVLGLNGNFTASTGWLTRFKQRHGIREFSATTIQEDEDEFRTPLVEAVYDTIQDQQHFSLKDTSAVMTGYASIPTDEREEEKEAKPERKTDVKLIDHSTAIYSVDNLLEYMNQWDFQYNDIITVIRIRSEIRKKLEDS